MFVYRDTIELETREDVKLIKCVIKDYLNRHGRKVSSEDRFALEDLLQGFEDWAHEFE